ncbi:MAG: hypothetical protein RMK01_08995 [Thermomicrobium sp.]|nr:hypothetical protein [Thermomicrobium sp.]MDW8060197.1 hypothetical protein [Thermomicrobium sp.]
MRQRGTWDDPMLDFDDEWDAVGRASRHRRLARRDAVSLEDARRLWEPVVCPACGARHVDTRSVRLRRAGRTVEARCGACGTVAAVYAHGVWTS